MPTAIADRLFVWTLTLQDGSVRTVLGHSLQSVGSGVFPSAVVNAVRGAAVNPDTPPAPPVLSTLTPATAALGSADFTLHVTGTGFTPGCTIVFAGQDEPTTFVSATEVTTGVNMSMWHGPDALPVKVRSLAGKDSNVLTFTFTP